MRSLFTINEAYPLYKIGGLGDVGGSLPPFLKRLNIDIRLAIPKHPEIDIQDSWQEISNFHITYDRKKLPIRIYHGFLPGTSVPTYLFSEDKYLSQYTDASDNHADKYTVFSLAISSWLNSHSPNWQPHIIHTHDWHTALIPVFLKHLYQNNKFKFISTIHNLSYQGITTTPILQKTALDPKSCDILLWDQIDNDINILMEGLLHSDQITTVSPTYAKEILTHQYGENLENILQSKKSRIKGIINGIDINTFNPQTDQLIKYQYDHSNYQTGKANNKMALLEQLHLPYSADRPLIGFVGRVDPKQKGIDLIIKSLKTLQLPLPNSTFIFLGTGDAKLEKLLHAASNSKNSTIITRYDETLAHQIYAASDLILIPSLFEPCGLVQLIAQRYGALPVARKTGGLIDTIKHNKNGFLFTNYSTKDMIIALDKALKTLSKPNTHKEMVVESMQNVPTWDNSAKSYKRLYQSVILE